MAPGSGPRALVNSQFVEGLSDDSIRRQYIVEGRSKWSSGRPYGFNGWTESIAEAYIAAGYQLQEVQHAFTSRGEITAAAVLRPLARVLPPTLTPMSIASNPMPTHHIKEMLAPSAAPMPYCVPEPLNLDSIAKLCRKLQAYTGEHRVGRSNPNDSQETGRCYNISEQGHLARGCQKNRPPSTG